MKSMLMHNWYHRRNVHLLHPIGLGVAALQRRAAFNTLLWIIVLNLKTLLYWIQLLLVSLMPELRPWLPFGLFLLGLEAGYHIRRRRFRSVLAILLHLLWQQRVFWFQFFILSL
jgi:hypothetical protein